MNIDILNAYCGIGFHRCHACLRVGLLAIAFWRLGFLSQPYLASLYQRDLSVLGQALGSVALNADRSPVFAWTDSMPVSPSSLVARRLGTNSFESRLCRTKGSSYTGLSIHYKERNDRTRLKFSSFLLVGKDNLSFVDLRSDEITR